MKRRSLYRRMRRPVSAPLIRQNGGRWLVECMEIQDHDDDGDKKGIKSVYKPPQPLSKSSRDSNLNSTMIVEEYPNNSNKKDIFWSPPLAPELHWEGGGGGDKIPYEFAFEKVQASIFKKYESKLSPSSNFDDDDAVVVEHAAGLVHRRRHFVAAASSPASSFAFISDPAIALGGLLDDDDDGLPEQQFKRHSFEHYRRIDSLAAATFLKSQAELTLYHDSDSDDETIPQFRGGGGDDDDGSNYPEDAEDDDATNYMPRASPGDNDAIFDDIASLASRDVTVIEIEDEAFQGELWSQLHRRCEQSTKQSFVQVDRKMEKYSRYRAMIDSADERSHQTPILMPRRHSFGEDSRGESITSYTPPIRYQSRHGRYASPVSTPSMMMDEATDSAAEDEHLLIATQSPPLRRQSFSGASIKEKPLSNVNLVVVATTTDRSTTQPPPHRNRPGLAETSPTDALPRPRRSARQASSLSSSSGKPRRRSALLAGVPSNEMYNLLNHQISELLKGNASDMAKLNQQLSTLQKEPPQRSIPRPPIQTLSTVKRLEDHIAKQAPSTISNLYAQKSEDRIILPEDKRPKTNHKTRNSLVPRVYNPNEK